MRRVSSNRNRGSARTAGPNSPWPSAGSIRSRGMSELLYYHQVRTWSGCGASSDPGWWSVRQVVWSLLIAAISLAREANGVGAVRLSSSRVSPTPHSSTMWMVEGVAGWSGNTSDQLARKSTAFGLDEKDTSGLGVVRNTSKLGWTPLPLCYHPLPPPRCILSTRTATHTSTHHSVILS
jgi:hypothetical protein